MRSLTVPIRSRALLIGAGALLATGSALVAAASSSAADPAHLSSGSDPRVIAAAAGSRFTLHELIDHSTESYTFTANGPMCRSGVFDDQVTVTSSNADHTVVHWQVSTTYTCDDGSGTFTAVKKVVRHQDPATSTTNSRWNVGAIRFTGGTGAFAGMSGHGHDVGAGIHQQAAGTITGRVIIPEAAAAVSMPS